VAAMNVGDRVRSRHGTEWMVIGGDSERLRVRSTTDGLTAWLTTTELERSYKRVSARPGLEGLEPQGRFLVRSDKGRACQLGKETK